MSFFLSTTEFLVDKFCNERIEIIKDSNVVEPTKLDKEKVNKYIITSCKRSVARRVRVSLTPETVVTIHVLYQNYKACENLLLYIFLA